jgi:spermidine synthase
MKHMTLIRDWHSEKLIYFSVTLISISILMFEIGLIRFFSVMFDSHYAFLAISLAVLGMGAGGIYVHIRAGSASDPELGSIQNLLPLSAGLMSISTLGITIFIIKISIFHHIFFSTFLSFIPFFFGGIFLSAAFRLFPDRSSKIYAADLIGASIGALLIVIILKLGGINANLFIAAIASFPACFLSLQMYSYKKTRAIFCFITGVLISSFLVNYFLGFLGGIPSAPGSHKEMALFLADPSRNFAVIETRWSAFGRTDLVADEKDPKEMVFFIDGTAGTVMYKFDKELNSLDSHRLIHFPGYFPFKLLSEEEKEKVLIIGSGGGREVLISLLGGAKEITAVEVNRDLVNIMKRYADFNGGIYNDYPGVKVVVEEGRNFIRATKEYYDIIMLSIPVTKTSRSPEGFALTENFLFTVESINDYLDRLTANGRLIVVAHADPEIFRLIFNSLAALKKRGISPSSAMKYLYTVGPQMFPVFVLKKSPLTPQEAQSVHLKMHEHNYSSQSSFIPIVEQVKHEMTLGNGLYRTHYMLNQALYLMAQGEIPPEDLTKLADFDLEAVTDDDPFFYKFEIGIPSVLIFLLIFSTIAMIVGWFIRPGSNMAGLASRNNILFLLLFSFLGIGFMLIEISLFQKFILFLGQPVYSVAMLLFSILIGAGIGSWMSGILWEQRTLLKIRLATIIVGLFVMAYALVLKHIFALFLGTPLFTRLVVSFLLLMPLGGVLGIPFPMGIKLLKECNLEKYVPRMWGVNGIGSVLGSALAIVLAISFGFSYALILGAILYIVISILFSMGFLATSP